MKLKRFVYISTVCVLAASIVIAVLVSALYEKDRKTALNHKDNAKATIKFYYISVDGTDGDKAIKNIINKFNQTQDGILVEGNSGMSVDKQLVSIMSGNAPDVGHTVWPSAIRWAQNGLLQDLDPYISKDHYDIEDFLPSTVDRARYRGISYALPFDINTMALYYNVDMLNSEGFTHPPRTMDELKTMAKKLTKTAENGEITVMGFLPDYPWLDNVLWPILFGAEFYNPEKNEVTTTSPEYVRAIEFQNWFYKEWGWNNISKFKLKFGANEQGPFYKRKLAMVMGGEWVPSEVKKYATDMKLGVCPFPYPDDKPYLKGTSMITTSVFYMPKDSKNKDSAWEFLKYLVSKDSMIDYTSDNKTLMARKSVLSDPAIKDNKDLRIFSEFALNKNIRGFPPLPIVDEYLDSLTEQIQMVFKQQKTPYEAMKEVKNKIDPLLKNNK